MTGSMLDRPGDEIERKASGVGCKQRNRHLSYKNRRSPVSAELTRRVKKNPQETRVSAVVLFPKIRFSGTDSRAGRTLLLLFNAHAIGLAAAGHYAELSTMRSV
jgi:hypothetical protein